MPHSILSERRWRWLLLLGIILLAALLRLYQLDRTPPGLHYDEAFNALQARDVLTGANRPIFFTGNFGEEPMQMYVEAAVFALAGQSPYTARLSNVLLGLLLIPALYFCGRVLFRSAVIALVAAFIGATLYWAINFSRLGIETGSLPWILTLSAGALYASNERRSAVWGIVAGVLTGATVYTYLASRMWPFAVGLWFIYLLITLRKQFTVRVWLAIGIAAALTAAPLALFFLFNPVALTGRAGQVLTLDTVGVNLLKTAAMFFFAGDTDPRDNLPGRAVLDPFLAVMFAIGLVVSLRRARKPAFAFLLIWFALMTLPSALTEFAPNMRRAIGALPAVALLCGVGVDTAYHALRNGLQVIGDWLSVTRKSAVREHGPMPLSTATQDATHHSPFTAHYSLVTGYRLAATLFLLLCLALSAYSSASAYFGEWAPGTGLFFSFDSGLEQAALALAARPTDEQICLSPDYHEHPTVLWTLDSRPFTAFDGRRAVVLPNSALATTCAIITREDTSSNLLQYYPGAERLGTIRDFDQNEYAQIVRIPAGATPTLQPQQPLTARLGDIARLAGYDLSASSETISVTLYWSAVGATAQDYTVFVHLLGPANPETGSPVWAQDDAQPGHGTFPTSRWRVGQTIIDRYELKRPLRSPAGEYTLEVGMYLLSTGERLPVSLDGQAAAQNRVLIPAHFR